MIHGCHVCVVREQVWIWSLDFPHTVVYPLSGENESTAVSRLEIKTASWNRSWIEVEWKFSFSAERQCVMAATDSGLMQVLINQRVLKQIN